MAIEFSTGYLAPYYPQNFNLDYLRTIWARAVTVRCRDDLQITGYRLVLRLGFTMVGFCPAHLSTCTPLHCLCPSLSAISVSLHLYLHLHDQLFVAVSMYCRSATLVGNFVWNFREGSKSIIWTGKRWRLGEVEEKRDWIVTTS